MKLPFFVGLFDRFRRIRPRQPDDENRYRPFCIGIDHHRLRRRGCRYRLRPWGLGMKDYGKIKPPVVAIWFMTLLMAVFLFFQQLEYSLVDPTDAKIAPPPAAPEQIEITPAML